MLKQLNQMFTGFEIIQTDQGLLELENEWNELWQQTPKAAMFQAFGYCYHAWLHIAKPEKRKLLCIVYRKEGKAVFIWPLVTYIGLRMIRILRPLGPCAAEYSHPLIHNNENAIQLVSDALEQAVRTSKCNIINVPFVKSGSPLDYVIKGYGYVNADEDFGPYVEYRNGIAWHDYYKQLSASYRRVQNKKRRQLASLGEVRFEVIDNKEQIPPVINWLLHEKRKWGERANKKGEWLFCSAYEKFLIALANDKQTVNPIIMFVLKLDGKIIAAQLAAICNSHVDWMIAGFDSDYVKRSPGILLNEECFKWAWDRKLGCDFGAGREENKMFWSRDTTHMLHSYQIHNGLIGYAAIHSWKNLRELRKKLAKRHGSHGRKEG